MKTKKSGPFTLWKLLSYEQVPYAVLKETKTRQKDNIKKNGSDNDAFSKLLLQISNF